MLHTLLDKERFVLRAHFGMVRARARARRRIAPPCSAALVLFLTRLLFAFCQDGLGPKTAREIAARLNVGEHTIGKLLQSGLDKLRHPQRAGYLERYAEARAL